MKSNQSPERGASRKHFGRLHTPLHAFLALPAHERSSVVWNTQLASLSKYIERGKELNAENRPVIVTKDMPLADPFYNHAWLEAYDALDNHPYQTKLLGLFADWWSLQKHVAFDVANQGILKRITKSPELLEVAMHAMTDENKEQLMLKIVKRQKFLHAVRFASVMRVITPIAEQLQWTSDFTNAETLRGNGVPFDPKSFIEAMASRLTAFGRFDTHHLELPSYSAPEGLNAYLDTAEMITLVEAAKISAPEVLLPAEAEADMSVTTDDFAVA